MYFDSAANCKNNVINISHAQEVMIKLNKKILNTGKTLKRDNDQSKYKT